MIGKRLKSTDSSYKHSHKKSAKSFAKGLDMPKPAAIIFATSDKRLFHVWETEGAEYDEKIHKRTVDIVPTADLRDVLDAISVKVLGAKEASARITGITDTATGLKDGTITIGDDIIIEGDKLKVDEKDTAQGVFFKAANGAE